jgi:hypothetical protein
MDTSLKSIENDVKKFEMSICYQNRESKLVKKIKKVVLQV